MGKIDAQTRKEALKRQQKFEAENRSRGGKTVSKRPLLNLQGFNAKEWLPVVGMNTLHIIPFIVSENWVGMVKPGYAHYKLEAWAHRNIGPNNEMVICPRTVNFPCPICEEKKRLQDAKEEKAADALKSSLRVFYNVIDEKDKNEEIKVFHVAHHLFEKEMWEKAMSLDLDDIISLDEGKAIKFRATEEKYMGGPYFKFKDFEFPTRQSWDDEIIEDAFPLDKMLIIESYNDLEVLFYGSGGTIEEATDDDDKIPEETAKTGRRRERAVEEKTPEEPVRTSRRERTTVKDTDNKCPYNYKFGQECNDYPECGNECPEEVFAECAEAHDAKMSVAKPEEPAQEATRPRGRRREQ